MALNRDRPSVSMLYAEHLKPGNRAGNNLRLILKAYHIGNKIHCGYKINEEEQWSDMILKIGFHHNIRITTCSGDIFRLNITGNLF